MTRTTRIAILVAAATLGAWAEAEAGDARWVGTGGTILLVAVWAVQEARRRRRRYPPMPEPYPPRAGTLEADGTPCRGPDGLYRGRPVET